MFNELSFALGYLKYYLTAQTRYDIHSPFVYDLVENVFKDKRKFYAFDEIEIVKREWIAKHENYPFTELGAGSKTMEQTHRNTAKVIKYNTVSPKYGQLLFKLINYFQPETILELGSSLGISTAYLASAKKAAQTITIEGCPETAKRAAKTFELLKLENNIEIINSDFTTALKSLNERKFTPDFVFLDGHHDHEATLKYFDILQEMISGENAMIIIDDIRWSKEMEKAWKTLIAKENVSLSIDLFRMGMVFFKAGVKKQHFVVRY